MSWISSKVVKDKKIHKARALNLTYRYIDDVLSINNSRFAEFIPLIYPPELEVKENQLRDVNTICRRSCYIPAHVWKIYDFKIEVVLFIINFSTELTEKGKKKPVGDRFNLIKIHLLFRIMILIQ
jgi:hypothetical protein